MFKINSKSAKLLVNCISFECELHEHWELKSCCFKIIQLYLSVCDVGC